MIIAKSFSNFDDFHANLTNKKSVGVKIMFCAHAICRWTCFLDSRECVFFGFLRVRGRRWESESNVWSRWRTCLVWQESTLYKSLFLCAWWWLWWDAEEFLWVWKVELSLRKSWITPLCVKSVSKRIVSCIFLHSSSGLWQIGCVSESGWCW